MAGAIKLTGISKRFRYSWIFRNINFEFKSGNPVAITGPNGSGKSTLVQVIAGLVTPSDGQVEYLLNGKSIAVDDIFQHISMVAPALELIEEMNLAEMLNFHFSFKNPAAGISKDDIAGMLGFAEDKEIRNYSSGMKQRLKLALAVFSKSELLLLDEPTGNLDEEGQQWYQKLIRDYSGDRIVIVSSNEPREYTFCDTVLDLNDYK